MCAQAQLWFPLPGGGLRGPWPLGERAPDSAAGAVVTGPSAFGSCSSSGPPLLPTTNPSLRPEKDCSRHVHVKIWILIVKTVFCKYSYISLSARSLVQILTARVHADVTGTTEQNQLNIYSWLQALKILTIQNRTTYFYALLFRVKWSTVFVISYYEVKNLNKNRFSVFYCSKSYAGVLIQVGVWHVRRQGGYADPNWGERGKPFFQGYKYSFFRKGLYPRPTTNKKF